MHSLSGILPALITPLDDDGHVNRASLEALLARLFEAGVHGTYVCGTTGEGLLLPVAMRTEIVDVVVANTPRDRAVVVHVGASAFEDARALARHAERVGASAVSSLPPSGPGFGFAEAKRYYQALAAVTGLPLVVYYFPEVYPSIRGLDQLDDLCAIPNVAGVKFTDFDLSVLAGASRPGRVVYNGRDEVLAAGLLMGAHGGIGSFYNLVPERFVRIAALAREGRWADARAEQDTVNRLITTMLRYPLFPAIKQVLTWSGIPCGGSLLPRAALTADQQAALRAAILAPDVRAVLDVDWPLEG